MSTEEIVKAIQGQIDLAKRLGNPNIFFSIDEAKMLIDLLNVRGEVTPYIDIDEAKCPNCMAKLTRQECIGVDVLMEDFFNYCPKCGRRVKWK